MEAAEGEEEADMVVVAAEAGKRSNGAVAEGEALMVEVVAEAGKAVVEAVIKKEVVTVVITNMEAVNTEDLVEVDQVQIIMVKHMIMTINKNHMAAVEMPDRNLLPVLYLI